MMPNIEFLSKLKLNDFALACATVLSLIYPSIVGLFLFDREFIVNNGVSVTILVSIGFGTIITSIVFNNTASILEKQLIDKPVNVKTFKQVLPHSILNQALSFGMYFGFVVPLMAMDESINEWIKYRYNPTFILYIIGFIVFNSIESTLKKLMLSKSSKKVNDPKAQPNRQKE